MKELTDKQIKILCRIFPVSALVGPVGILMNIGLYIILGILIVGSL